MRGINKVILIGNANKKPEIKEFSGGKLATFGLATSYKKKDGTELTEWHNINVFGVTADIAYNYIDKGTRVYVEGRMQTSKYTDKDGVQRKGVNIIANVLQVLSYSKDVKNNNNNNNNNDHLDYGDIDF